MPPTALTTPAQAQNGIIRIPFINAALLDAAADLETAGIIDLVPGVEASDVTDSSKGASNLIVGRAWAAKLVGISGAIGAGAPDINIDSIQVSEDSTIWRDLTETLTMQFNAANQGKEVQLTEFIGGSRYMRAKITDTSLDVNNKWTTFLLFLEIAPADHGLG